MVSYDAVASLLESDDTLFKAFELSSFSRGYNGYTLFARHFYYHRSKESDTVIENLADRSLVNVTVVF